MENNKIGKYSKEYYKKEKNMATEIIKFVIYTLLIVAITKYVLVKLLRRLAEALDLSAKAVGNIAGVATSIPELLTVSFSAYAGLIGTGIYNIISSNSINLILYLTSIIISKNQKALKNKAIKVDLILVIATIIIPIIMLMLKTESSIFTIPIFIVLFIFFYFINSNAHKLYLKKQDKMLENEIKEEIEKEKKWIRKKVKIITKYAFYLVITSVSLYIIGNALSVCLENLALHFKIPEIILGTLLGFTTSIPELITFFESQKHHKNTKNKELGVIESTNNLLTSNIVNICIVQTIAIVIYEIFK